VLQIVELAPSAPPTEANFAILALARPTGGREKALEDVRRRRRDHEALLKAFFGLG